MAKFKTNYGNPEKKRCLHCQYQIADTFDCHVVCLVESF